MPQTVDLFLDSDQPLERVASQLGELIDAQLIAAPDQAHFVVRNAQVTAYLSEHDFVDDDDLPLSDFRYVLSAVVGSESPSPEDSPELAWLRGVNSAWREGSGMPSLLVIDLERRDVSPVAPTRSATGP
jgi:hypothetical protein